MSVHDALTLMLAFGGFLLFLLRYQSQQELRTQKTAKILNGRRFKSNLFKPSSRQTGPVFTHGVFVYVPIIPR